VKNSRCLPSTGALHAKDHDRVAPARSSPRPPSTFLVLHSRIPTRRRTRTPRVEKILVPKKRADSIRTADRESSSVADVPRRRRVAGREPRLTTGWHSTATGGLVTGNSRVERAREYSDPDHSESEERFILLGMSRRLRVLVICHCYRESESVIRIMSARRADRSEEEEYWR
jgi:tetrahydromethanopterin S-methyltransferase subunit F